MKKWIFLVGLAMGGFLQAGKGDQPKEAIKHIMRVFVWYDWLSERKQARLLQVLRKYACPSQTRVVLSYELLKKLKPFVKRTGCRNDLFQRWLFTFCRRGDGKAAAFLIDNEWALINGCLGGYVTVLDDVVNNCKLRNRQAWINYLESKGACRSQYIVPEKIRQIEKRKAKKQRAAQLQAADIIQHLQATVQQLTTLLEKNKQPEQIQAAAQQLVPAGDVQEVLKPDQERELKQKKRVRFKCDELEAELEEKSSTKEEREEDSKAIVGRQVRKEWVLV